VGVSDIGRTNHNCQTGVNNTCSEANHDYRAPMIRSTPLAVAFACLALVALTTGCNKPKKRSKAPTVAGQGNASSASNDNYRGPVSRGGAQLPKDTPAAVVERIQGIPISASANVRALIALGDKAIAAMAALADSENIAEANAAMRYFELTGHKQGGAPATKLVQHPVPSLRQQALLALTAIADATHLPALTEALNKAADATTRSLAIRAIAVLKSTESAAVLLTKLDDPDEQVTVEVAAALATIGDTSKQTLATLATKSANATPSTALGALTAIRLLGEKVPVSRATLDAPLGHADARVVMAATRLVHRLGGDDAAMKATIMDKLLADKRAPVRRVALAVLPQLGLEDGAMRAQKMLTDASPEVAGEAAAALAVATPKADRPATLIPLLAHASPQIRQRAAVELGKLGDEVNKPLVARLALERDQMALLLLARAIGRKKLEAAVEPLITVLEDRASISPVLVQARDSLEAITGEKLGVAAQNWRQWLAKKNPKKAPEATPPAP